ncbi:Lipopolysaccharide biosynthesis protein WzxC [Halioglobus japonicus]|nr:Lipopolysaccharide biosynthesis protein WzxC [Halioglobus japonicus]
MDIRSKVMSALRWSAAARFLGQAVSWGITIMVIRLLSPGDYGLMAMAMVVVSLLILLNTVGLDAVLVQDREIDEQMTRQIFGVVIVVNVLFFLLLLLSAETVAAFYGEPALAPIVQVLSFQFLLLIFETLPQSKLERDIEFAQRSVVDFATLVMGSLVTLVMALTGFGVWALIWGMLATNATRMIGLNLIARNLVWPSFSLRGMRKHFAFGGFVTTDRGLWYLFSESDKFIGGKLLGNHLLGYYAVASQLASLPIHKISGLLNSVAFPAFSHAHAHTDAETVQNYLLKATRILSIAAFPVFFGISCTAEPLIACLLGEKWLPAAPLLQLLGVVMPFRLMSNIFPPLLWGVGSPAVSASNFLIAALLMPVAFYAGTHWGVIGLAYAWLCMYPVVFFITAFRTCRRVGVGLPGYLLQMLRPVAAGITMYAAVYFMQGMVFGTVGDWVYLLQLVVVGVLAYGVAMLLIDRKGVLETLQLIRT